MDKEKRLNTLLESYEILSKRNNLNNISDIIQIIGQITKYNIDLAFELWYKTILQNKKLLTDSDYEFWLTDGAIFQMTNHVNERDIYQHLYNNKDLSVLCFKVSTNTGVLHIPLKCLEEKMYEQAIYFYELIISSPQKIQNCCILNKYDEILSHDERIGYLFEYFEHKYFTDTAIEIMYSWIDTVSNQEIKARLNSIMVSIEEYHDENIDENQDDEI